MHRTRPVRQRSSSGPGTLWSPIASRDGSVVMPCSRSRVRWSTLPVTGICRLSWKPRTASTVAASYVAGAAAEVPRQGRQPGLQVAHLHPGVALRQQDAAGLHGVHGALLGARLVRAAGRLGDRLGDRLGRRLGHRLPGASWATGLACTVAAPSMSGPVGLRIAKPTAVAETASSSTTSRPRPARRNEVMEAPEGEVESGHHIDACRRLRVADTPPYSSAGDSRRPRQAARRRTADVRRGRPALRPDQRRPLPRSGPALAPGRHRRGRPAPRRAGARPGRRHRYVEPAVRRPRRGRGAVRLLPRHAPGRQEGQAGAAVHRRRRHPAAVRRRHLRRRHDLLRAAQHRRPAGRAARAAPRHPARRPARGLRVQPPDLGAVPDRLRRVPHARAAAHRPRGLVLTGRLRLPRRVDPRLARPARASPT